MIHALCLIPRLIVARLALRSKTRLILQHLEYSPHSQALAQPDALGGRFSKTAKDLLSLIPQAEHAPTNSSDQPERPIPSRLPRRDSAACSRVDDATDRPLSPPIPRNSCKARIPSSL